MSGETAPLPVVAFGPSRAEEFARIERSGLIGAGQVFLLSLEAIERELGDRWPLRHERVWESAENALTKNMPLPDIFFRVNNSTILAAIASCDAYEAQSRCAEVMRGVLSHFLGRDADSDLRIDQVLSLEGAGLSCAAVDLRAPRPAALPMAAPEPSGRGWSPPLAGRQVVETLTSDRFGDMPFVLELAPVWRLDLGAISAYAFRRRLAIRSELLSDADRERVLHLVLDMLLPILADYSRNGGAFALIVPCPLDVVTGRRSRQAFLDRCVDVANVMRKVVILEIDGIDPGVPAGRLKQMAAMIRPFVAGLMIETAQSGNGAAGHPFTGASLSARAAGTKVESMTRSARRQTSNVLVHDVGPTLEDQVLQAWGASHITRFG